MLFLYRPRETWMPFSLPRNQERNRLPTPAVAAAVPIHPARAAGGAAAQRDPIADLKELAALHASNALTDAEFETAKAQLLGQ